VGCRRFPGSSIPTQASSSTPGGRGSSTTWSRPRWPRPPAARRPASASRPGCPTSAPRRRERRRRGAEGRSHLDLGTHLGLAFRYQGWERDLERVLEEEVTGVRMHTNCRGTIVDVDDWTWLRLLRRSGSGRLPVRVHAESDDILGDRRRERRREGKAWFARHAQSRPAVAIAAAMPRAGARDGITAPRPAPASLRWSRRRPCSARPGWRGVASGFGGRSGWRLGPGPGLRTVATRRRSRPEFDADVRSRAARAAAGRGCGGVW